ncbi:MAG: TatD family hydrolase, partial [Planctomycetota bacterium]
TMIDTHCHLTFTQYQGQVPAELQRMREAGVRGCITVGTTSADSAAGLAIAEAHEGVWCSAGVHPLHSDEPVDWGALKTCAQHPRCVAWGELGLDNHYPTPVRATQMAALEGQLDRIARWAAEGLSKPIIIHCRKAFDELLPVLAASGLPRDRFVFHCFSGVPDEARRVLDFGAWISFTGIVTYRNAPEVQEAARLVPEDRIMVETDAPFLSPEPMRTAKPNRPAHVAIVARHLAAIRGADEADFLRTLDANACRFFGLPPA